MTGDIHLVFVTQLIDPADPVLGFTVSLIRALAARTASLLVIANEVRHVPEDLAGIVQSMGKEEGRGRVAKGARYQYLLAGACREHRPVTLLAHMCPPYLTLGAPIVRATGGRSLLWYAHRSHGPALRRAERLADAILTTLPGTYPGDSPKVRAIGQNIDTAQFVMSPLPARDGPLRLVAIGRTAAVKRYPVLVRAVAQARAAGVDVELRIVGPSTTAAEQAHAAELDGLIRTVAADGAIRLDADVAPDAVPEVLAGAHALVNDTPSVDKVVFEAMAAGRPALASSPVLAPVLEVDALRLSFTPGDAADLAARIGELAAAPPDVLAAIGARLRRRVEDSHSLDRWADQVVAVAREVRPHGRGRG